MIGDVARGLRRLRELIRCPLLHALPSSASHPLITPQSREPKARNEPVSKRSTSITVLITVEALHRQLIHQTDVCNKRFTPLPFPLRSTEEGGVKDSSLSGFDRSSLYVLCFFCQGTAFALLAPDALVCNGWVIEGKGLKKER